MSQILSDQLLRDRYDSLLENGIYEYDPQRNYDEVDMQKGHKPRPQQFFRYRDARAQFKAVEDQEAFAFFVSASWRPGGRCQG